MTFERAHYLPIIVTLLFPFTFILTYSIAVINEDVTPLFPYISDTGAFSPESCIFGQLLNLGAMLMAVISYLRYLQVKDIYENINTVHPRFKLNWYSSILGYIAALGISIVGNFQESNAIIVHLTGAVLAFGLGGVYCFTQTYISFKIYPHLGHNILNWIRMVLSFGTVGFFILTLLFATLSFSQVEESERGGLKPKWKPGEPGWTWHFISTLSEWILALCLIFFLASYTCEFKRLSLTPIRASNKLK